MEDNIAESVKKTRLYEIIATFRSEMIAKNAQQEPGRLRLVLIEGYSNKHGKSSQTPMMTGRTDGNKRVIFPAITQSQLNSVLSSSMSSANLEKLLLANNLKLVYRNKNTPQQLLDTGSDKSSDANLLYKNDFIFESPSAAIGITEQRDEEAAVTSSTAAVVTAVDIDQVRGQYCVVFIEEARGSTLRGRAVGLSSLQTFHTLRL